VLKLFVLSLLPLSGGFKTPPPCAAMCQCVYDGTVQDAVAHASVVFVGRVVASTDTLIDYGAGPGHGVPHSILTFLVDQRWKGPRTDSIRILTPQASTACGAFFMPGSNLVFAHADTSGLFFTSSCDRNRSLKEARKDIRALGRPVFRRSGAAH
jgi:hypothetical protein